MITTNNQSIAEEVRLLSTNGLNRSSYKYGEIVKTGFKLVMTDIQATMGLVQLSKAETLRQKRKTIANKYNEGFIGTPGLIIPPSSLMGNSSYHLYTLILDEELDRDKFLKYLLEKGINTSIHYKPLHTHPYFKEYEDTDFPIANEVGKRIFSLPLYPDLTGEQIEYIIENVKTCIDNYDLPLNSSS